MIKEDEKVVFAIGNDGETDVVLLGISEKSWEYMKDGKTHTFDLARLGLPFKVVLFGGKTRESIMEIVKTLMHSDARDVSAIDMSIKPKIGSD
jgi:hypothetical protein